MTKQVTDIQHRWVHQDVSIRLDQFLTKKFSGISRAYLQSLIVDKKVKVNGIYEKKGAVVHNQDVVTVDPFTHPDDRMIEPPTTPALSILKETEHYIVIDKPAGLPTHPNDFLDTACVANHFIGLYPEANAVGEDALRPGIVHRLDTYTSGVLVLAKTQAGYEAFRKLFDVREMKKTYQALVLGAVYPADIEIDTPLAHHHRNPRKMVAVVDDRVLFRSKLRNAVTMVSVRQRYQSTTWVEVKTLTGRMHQVRVHMASIGHPLVGDRLYQDQKQKQQDKYGMLRHFLHASEIRFKDPWTGNDVRVQSVFPPELEACIEKMPPE